MIDRKLLVSVHDATPRHFDRLRAIDEWLARRGVDSYSMLVVPNFWYEWPLASHPGFAGWLRDRASAGVEMMLHGYYHKDDRPSSGPLRARVTTAGEGEFSSLPRDEAEERIARGRAELEAALDRPVDLFVAPAWLYSAGTHDALAALGFRIAEDQLRVWSPSERRTLARGPVVSYASRSLGRVISSIAWSRVATIALAPQPLVRFAVHPHDLDSPALTRELDRALAILCERRTLTRYADLV